MRSAFGEAARAGSETGGAVSKRGFRHPISIARDELAKAATGQPSTFVSKLSPPCHKVSNFLINLLSLFFYIYRNRGGQSAYRLV